MNTLIILLSYTIILLFLCYKFYKNNTYLNNEINKLNTSINDINNLLLLENTKEKLESKSNNNTNNIQSLKNDYENYVLKNSYDTETELPNDLKNQINSLNSEYNLESLENVSKEKKLG